MALRLPEAIRACLFDLDGVLTRTAEVHAAAWKEMFDGFLQRRAHGEPFVAFDAVGDYDAYVDGRPRLDGTRSFLRSRGIDLPEGHPDDPPDVETVNGLSNAKNGLLLSRLREHGVQVFPGSIRFVRAARAAGLGTAVVSSSANALDVLVAAGVETLFDQRVDAVVASDRKLAGKPSPDTFLAAADLLDVQPAQAAVFEDALAGVEAGRAGRFGLVVGVDRTGQADALVAHGADIVVSDLEELVEDGSDR
ncbi:MAG TPA: beta-phosphoglucomutase family hydrolase [Acidimicrobiales bacterium]|nr:beta-phosphoglucomutase family hydrolase [Acidimicrobiales bacterium]